MMAKRLKFIRGADEFIDRGVVFEKGGPGQEVEDDRYDVLTELVGYDFQDETEEEYEERVAAEDKLREEEEAAVAATEEQRQEEIDTAQRTADFFNADSVAEQEEKGVPAPDSGRPATDQGVGDESVDDTPDDEPDPDDDDELDAGLRSRFPE
jgi:hypothetical protein